ncbi:MAG: hypothetical protein CME38_19325 [Haliea sp.]|nr:hypothetical protein [Haliea sp.]
MRFTALEYQQLVAGIELHAALCRHVGVTLVDHHRTLHVAEYRARRHGQRRHACQQCATDQCFQGFAAHDYFAFNKTRMYARG